MLLLVKFRGLALVREMSKSPFIDYSFVKRELNVVETELIEQRGDVPSPISGFTVSLFALYFSAWSVECFYMFTTLAC